MFEINSVVNKLELSSIISDILWGLLTDIGTACLCITCTPFVVTYCNRVATFKFVVIANLLLVARTVVHVNNFVFVTISLEVRPTTQSIRLTPV